MILFDTETTGLIKPMSVPLDQQPELIEFAAMRLDDKTLDEIHRLTFFVKPRHPLSAENVKVHGITNEMLATALTFPRHVRTLQEFFLGERTCVAHNIPFDISMLLLELQRIDHVTKFPWPLQQLCTVELSMDLPAKRDKSDRLKLVELYQYFTGHEPAVKHRAMDDVETLAACVRGLRAVDGRI